MADSYSMPRSRSSSLSCQTVFPEHEQTVLSSAIFTRQCFSQCSLWSENIAKKNVLSQTPALRAMTPTNVSGSFLSNCKRLATIYSAVRIDIGTFPSCCPATTILRPIISQMWMGLSKNTAPTPSSPTSTLPKTPRLGLACSSACTASQISPADSGPCDMSPDSRTVAW